MYVFFPRIGGSLVNFCIWFILRSEILHQLRETTAKSTPQNPEEEMSQWRKEKLMRLIMIETFGECIKKSFHIRFGSNLNIWKPQTNGFRAGTTFQDKLLTKNASLGLCKVLYTLIQFKCFWNFQRFVFGQNNKTQWFEGKTPPFLYQKVLQ